MPNRIIKESVCSSDKIDQLGWFDEVLFYRLIVNCDDYGRFDGRSAIVKNRLFPLKDNLTKKAVEDSIHRLATVGLISTYEIEGKPYLQLPAWERHQNVRAKKSKYPAPESVTPSSAIHPAASDSLLQEHETICKQMLADVPVIQSNPNPNPYPNPETGTHAEEAAATGYDPVSDYLDRINPSPSPTSVDELRGYAQAMGGEVCRRAMDVALDAKKANWPYIRGILRSKLAAGVKCLADWDRLEEARETAAARKADKMVPPMPDSGTDRRIREDLERMKKYLEETQAVSEPGEEG